MSKKHYVTSDTKDFSLDDSMKVLDKMQDELEEELKKIIDGSANLKESNLLIKNSNKIIKEINKNVREANRRK